MNNNVILILVFTFGLPLFAQEKIDFTKVVTEVPLTTKKYLKASFTKDTLPAWAGIIGSTAVLYHYDSDLYEGAQRTGRRWGLSNSDHTKTVAKLGPYDLLRLPTDTASTLYFLGDGWTDIAIGGGLLAYGYFNSEVRPYNTALQIFHGMTVSAISVQVIKRATGRESPTDRTEPRGRWRPFPSIKAYNASTAKYDAMPSGHVMTSTLVFTILRTNYPEYDNVLLPLEVTWLTALGFAMMNNGVHWASDYPLAIGMGYIIGKASASLGQPSFSKRGTETKSWAFFPSVDEDGLTPTLNAVKNF